MKMAGRVRTPPSLPDLPRALRSWPHTRSQILIILSELPGGLGGLRRPAVLCPDRKLGEARAESRPPGSWSGENRGRCGARVTSLNRARARSPSDTRSCGGHCPHAAAPPVGRLCRRDPALRACPDIPSLARPRGLHPETWWRPDPVRQRPLHHCLSAALLPAARMGASEQPVSRRGIRETRSPRESGRSLLSFVCPAQFPDWARPRERA